MKLKMQKLRRIVIKQELVELTGDFKKAIILNQFIYWSERIKDVDKYIAEEKERAKKHEKSVQINLSKGWIYKSAEELSEEIMLGMSKQTIRRHIKVIVANQWLMERENPVYSWDKTKQYRVNLLKIQTDLNNLGYSLEGYSNPYQHSNSKMEPRNSTTEHQNNNFGTAIPEITNTDVVVVNEPVSANNHRAVSATETTTDPDTSSKQTPSVAPEELTAFNLQQIQTVAEEKLGTKIDNTLLSNKLLEHNLNSMLEGIKYLSTKNIKKNVDGYFLRAVRNNWANTLPGKAYYRNQQKQQKIKQHYYPRKNLAPMDAHSYRCTPDEEARKFELLESLYIS